MTSWLTPFKASFATFHIYYSLTVCTEDKDSMLSWTCYNIFSKNDLWSRESGKDTLLLSVVIIGLEPDVPKKNIFAILRSMSFCHVLLADNIYRRNLMELARQLTFESNWLYFGILIIHRWKSYVLDNHRYQAKLGIPRVGSYCGL